MWRYAAYVLFLLACAIPGWYLRDIVAAEAQLRRIGSMPANSIDWGHWCHLGTVGQEYLWSVSSDKTNEFRANRAIILLEHYDSPRIARWFLQVIGDRYSPTLNRVEAIRWLQSPPHRDSLRSCLRQLQGHEVFDLLTSNEYWGVFAFLLFSYWEEQPNAARDVARRFFRESSDHWDPWEAVFTRTLPTQSEAEIDDYREFMHGAMRAGVENPHREMREFCDSVLRDWESLCRQVDRSHQLR